MRRICVFLRRDLQEKWRGNPNVEWCVCKKCSRRILHRIPDNDMLEWWVDARGYRNPKRKRGQA